MPAQITGLLGRLQKSVREFSLAQRTLALIGVAGLVLGAMALSTWASKPTMSPLFTGLAASDASAIVDQLEAEGVTYELADGGSSVLVPADDVYAMRLAVAAAGLPTASDGAGYSLLDDMGMTSSEFQQQVTYQRALEGELSKTIESMSGVEAATVRLAIPEETVFVSETADPTASVFVRTQAGGALDSDKVQSIVHLVSAGIEGMSPTDVAVIDADGKVLSAVGGAQQGGLQGSQTAEYEARVAGNVQTMLERVVGVGNAVVTVTADLDYDQLARTSETYTPAEGAPPLSAATSAESYTGGAEPATGVLGPDGTPQPATDGTGEYSKESSTVNNAVNKVTEQVTSTPGAVRRQSVSVVVSADSGAALDMADLQETVVAAAGIDATRGDVVSVSRMAFDTTTAEAAQEALAAADADAKAAAQADLIKQAAIGAAVLLLLVAASIVMARRSKRARREAIDLGAIELVEAAQREVIEPAPTPAFALPPAEDPAKAALAAKRDDVMALAADQPAEVAEVLRGWLVGGRR
ncbi:flagellar M-ring protein FliF [Actinotalea ferrariae]|uniref:flagellar basal-body MS-ring/collar protein FliF n=1 Tax=Actinotalea ferrariae TaxID=1386098 RepID=UPI001C8BF1C4|nr:flagellar basal-body MS-ring/collar protein FliF [Actinotalea ferrariae]MBX9246628.1 flagellar M-ring protein FliF [Actinotalea ferrariae]